MSEWTFGRAKIALFDPAYMNRQATLGALQHLGFSNVDPFSRPEDLVHRLQDKQYHLIIAEMREYERDIFRLVTQVRAGALGENPFVAILLTSWELSQDTVKIVINSGADDLLGRPFSIAQLQQRVQAVAAARKPYVVTCDYMGPSRRKSKRTPEDDGLFEAPNTFKGLVVAKARTLSAEHLMLGWKLAQQWRQFRLGERIRILGHLTAKAREGETPAAALAQSLEEMGKRIRALDTLAAHMALPGHDKILAYNTALLRIVERLSQPETNWASDQTAEKIRVMVEVCDHIFEGVKGHKPAAGAHAVAAGAAAPGDNKVVAEV